jgi:hypothetical protein
MTNADSNHFQAERTERARRATPARPTKSLQATMLLLSGLATTILGLALSILPIFSWQAHQIMNGLDVLGVHGGALAVGGMMLIGLGMIRGQVQANASLADSGVDSEIVEEMAADVVQMRNAVDHMQMVVSGMQGELKTVRDEIVAAMPQPVAPVVNEVPAGGGNEDAIFRLAASLDKVGAKIEERLKAQFTELQGRIDSVESSVRVSAATVATATPVQPVAEAPVAAAPAVAPVAEQVQPEAPAAPERSLGVLDSLDDEVVGALPNETTIDFDEIDKVQLDGDTALPKSPGTTVWEEGLEMVETGDEATDARLRAALEEMRRQGGQPDMGPGLGR